MNKKIIAEIAKIKKQKEKEIVAAEAKAEKAKAAIVTPMLKELKDLLETLKEVAPKELEDTIRTVGLPLNTITSSNTATDVTSNTNTATSNVSNTSVSNVNTSTTVSDINVAAPSSEVMQEAFDKGQGQDDQKVKKTRRSQKQVKASASERAQKRAEKKAQDEAEALDITVPEKYNESLKIMYRSKKVCRGFYKGIPFSAGVNVGGVMVFNPMRYDLEAEIEKVLLDCNFIDPKDLTKDPYKVRESYGSVQKLRSGDYCGYVVGSDGFVTLFVKSINKERPCIMGLPSFMEGDTKPHASHDGLVSATVKELIAAHTAKNPNAVVPEIATTVSDSTPEPYSVGRDDSPDLDMDFGDDLTAEDFEDAY